jgi:hypothetical protein
VADDVAANVAASRHNKPLISDDVADVALSQGVGTPKARQASAGLGQIEDDAYIITKSCAKQGLDPEPLGGATPSGAKILDEIVAIFRRHIILKPHQAESMALWVLHAHSLNAYAHSPRLHLKSPVLGCGKTNLASLLEDLTKPQSFMASSFTISAYVRLIDKAPKNKDTTVIIILDEVDKFISEDKKTTLGILNSGHTRAGATKIMSEMMKDKYEPMVFSTWAATAFASIGPLPAELESRSIIIELQRKKRGEHILPIKGADRKNYRGLAKLVAGWVREHFAELEDAEPACPDCLYNRARDNWLPLLAVADVAGGHWPQTARAAAKALSGELEDPTEGIKLLADIRQVFDQSGGDRLSTDQLIRGLAGLVERPWGDYGDGFRGQDPRPITDRQLAKILGPFGIQSKSIRIGAGTPKGYMRESFEDAWERYLTPSPAATSATLGDFNGLDPDLSATSAATRSATEPQQSPRLGGRAGLLA